MTCTDCQKSMHLYLDDKLEPPQLADMEAHLADCSACRCEVEDWQQYLAVLQQSYPEPTAPLRVWQKIEIQ